MTVESPCIKTCVIDPVHGLCRGCGRTLSEIGSWVSMLSSERRAIMAALPERLRNAGLSQTDHAFKAMTGDV
jgi:predicted Fe-S protein YdhL (DUF1289 family)